VGLDHGAKQINKKKSTINFKNILKLFSNYSNPGSHTQSLLRVLPSDVVFWPLAHL
jgi:hypothetical protein